MTATTPKGFPYPEGTDRLMDGDNAIQALAEAVDDLTGASWGSAGQITGVIAGTPTQVTVTFPVGHFDPDGPVPTPVAGILIGSGNPTNIVAGTGQPGWNACLVIVQRPSNGTVNWQLIVDQT